MFEHLFFYLSKLLFKDNICKDNYFLLFYYVVSLLYLCPSFLEFVVSSCPAVSYHRGRVRVHASVLRISLMPKKYLSIPKSFVWNWL